jgi:hypothetical protein
MLIGRRRQARGAWVLVVAVGMLAGTGCSGGGVSDEVPSTNSRTGASVSGEVPSTNPPTGASAPARSEGLDPSLVQTFDFSVEARHPMLDSNLPERIEFPPSGRVTSLLADPPGRAVVQLFRYRSFEDVTGWHDQVTYFYGADGRWRSLVMSELGLDATRWAGPDSGWSGSLSPDGRYWAFPTSVQPPGALADRWGPVAVMDLRTAEYEFHYPDAGRRTATNPLWTSARTLAFDWKQRGRDRRAVVDVVTGETRKVNVSFSAGVHNLIYQRDGSALTVKRPPKLGSRSGILVTYSPELRKVAETTIPFPLPGNDWEPVALGANRIAFSTPKVQTDGPATGSPGLIVTNRDLEPQAILSERNGREPWSGLAWLNDDYLMFHAWTSNRRVERVFAWHPDSQQVYQLTGFAPTREVTDLVIGDIVASAVRVQSADKG